MYDFVAIDFETASSDLSSACSVGIVAVEGFKLADQFYSLIQPPRNYYEQTNITIHGITPEMTADAPTLTELWPHISRFFDRHIPVVAHNARFDMSVLRLSTNLNIPDFIYVDSIDVASLFCDGHKDLVSCAKAMGVYSEGFKHHNALSDAVLCAKITATSIDELECRTMWEFLVKNPYVKRDAFSALRPQKQLKKKGGTRFQKIDIKSITPTVGAIDESSPLYGKTIVFTGTLSMERSEAMQLAVNAGANIKSSVSSKTDYLVVGTQDKALVGDDGMSSKEEKAYALNEAGKANIVFLTEEDFLHLVNAEVQFQ